MEKKWYIVHAYSNFENKVADSIREQAKQRGLAEHIGEVLVPKEKVTEARRGRKVLIERRPPTGLWGGLWSLPEFPTHAHAVQWCGEHLSGAANLQPDTPIRHAFSHFDYEIKPLRVTRLGRRHSAERVITQTSPRGETMYWIGNAGAAKDDSDGTDFHATFEGHLSVTPLHVDLTEHTSLSAWASRLAGGAA